VHHMAADSGNLYRQIVTNRHSGYPE
jgi:hypothetical protein